jgi:hypothetical protein
MQYGEGLKEQTAISQLLLQRFPDFIFRTGDLVYPMVTYEKYGALFFAFYQVLMKDIPFFGG